MVHRVYRLKTTDKDGSVAYSSIARLFFENISQVSLFPNPASSAITLSMNAARAGKDLYTIVDMTGKKLMEKTIVLERGANRITIDLSTLRSGTYILYTQSGFAGKLVKP
ncbi:MAG: T9SS type A sorting domain-containing protein [Chitinophagaceae bacterium]|nr:T9SS type A sorting domain-containing protein [Chitinophagaceae bacterium]